MLSVVWLGDDDVKQLKSCMAPGMAIIIEKGGRRRGEGHGLNVRMISTCFRVCVVSICVPIIVRLVSTALPSSAKNDRCIIAQG